MKKLLYTTAAFCLIAAPAFAATKILFIGNSFTFGAHSSAMHYETDQVHDLNPPDKLGRTIGGVPALFKEFTKEAGLDYDVSLETVGGKGFDYHLAEKKPLIDKAWDVVVGHGFSTLDEAHPGDPALLIASTKEMADMLAARNPQVKFYTIATWSRADKVYPADAPAPWKGMPIQQMGKDVEKAYEAAAKNAGGKVTGVIPLGMTWNAAIDQGLADDNPYDDKGADKMNFWAYDSYHASSFGYYLEAAMDFGKVTGKDPMMLAAKGKDHVAEDLGISPKQQQALLKLAHDGLASTGQTFVAMND
ncbi:MAG TPA: hypothetical protein VNW15_05900 [Rhizomicrobium sp.]|jgi:hypothetical protein|nr:hypothetical protein [Rhizomicrobium sp.]